MSYEPSKYFMAEQVAEFIIKDQASANNQKAYDIAGEIEEKYGLHIDDDDVKRHLKNIYGSDHERAYKKLEDAYPSYFHSIIEDDEVFSNLHDDIWEAIMNESSEDSDILDFKDEL